MTGENVVSTISTTASTSSNIESTSSTAARTSANIESTSSTDVSTSSTDVSTSSTDVSTSATAACGGNAHFENQYFLGCNYGAAYWFYYEKDRATTLDIQF